MQIIQNNPYRITGLLVGATAKEKDRQIKRLKQFIEAEQEPEEDYSFPILGYLKRTVNSINEAASKIDIDADKMVSALFWFYNGNPITDEPALDSLKEGDVDGALKIWNKLIVTGLVYQRNASAFNNLANLYLSGCLDKRESIDTIYEKGISYKLKFLESDSVIDFKRLATDETYKTTKEDLQIAFLNIVQSELSVRGELISNKFLEIISKQEFTAKEKYFKGFVQKPIEQIERKIEEARKIQLENKSKACDIGNQLFDSTNAELLLLKSLLSISDLKLISVSDKLANELLQCSITCFNHFYDSETEVGEICLTLAKRAKSVVLGGVVKTRVDETIISFAKYVKERPDRERHKKIGTDLNFITAKLKGFQNLDDTIANAANLVNSCKPKLHNVKMELGYNDELYLSISSAIVRNAQGMVVTVVNSAQETYALIHNIFGLKNIVDEAYDLTNTLASFDMLPELRLQFQKNREVITSIRNQLYMATAPKPKSSTGCYVATMAYGSYDHPQVIVLRKFRDEVLSNSKLGRLFIKLYYTYSPKFVEKVKNRRTLNIIIRKGLNQFIKCIKK